MTRVLIMSVAVWVGAAASWPATGASLSGQILMEDGSPYYVPVTATVASGNPVRWDNPTPTHHTDRKSTRLNSSHIPLSRMPPSA